jgi:hypothetical protein
VLVPVSLIASDTSIKAALQPVKLFEGIGKGSRDWAARRAAISSARVGARPR